jgi:hypothetical protein
VKGRKKKKKKKQGGGEDDDAKFGSARQQRKPSRPTCESQLIEPRAVPRSSECANTKSLLQRTFPDRRATEDCALLLRFEPDPDVYPRVKGLLRLVPPLYQEARQLV